MTQSLMEQSQYDRGLREQALAHLQMDLSDEQLDEIFVNDRELFEAMEEQANRHAVGREPASSIEPRRVLPGANRVR